MDIHIPDEFSQQKLDKLVNKLNHCINTVLDKACPMTQDKLVDRNNPWWTKQLKDLRKAVFASYDRSKVNPEDRETYKQRLNKYKKLCNKEKHADWKDTQEKIPNEEGMAEHLKILTDTSTPKITFINTPQGNTEPGKETCKAIINTHFPAATEEKPTEYDITLRVSTSKFKKQI